MFRQRATFHSAFRLLELGSQVCLTEHQELHLLEIPKFHREIEDLREPLDFWLYFLKNGKDLDADAVPGPLDRPEIRKAMEVLKVFSQSELERDRYENRIKGQRDLMALKRERDEAVRERDDSKRELEVGKRELEDSLRRLEEAEQARKDAARKLEEAILQQDLTRQELIRAGKQSLISRIQLCQKLLGQSQATCDQLMGESLDSLQALADQWERQLTASLG